mmetsp:Transcript_9653/g.29843  ORF Transcript_9653/g.29843 Transcript_9653/m.29843 type:complete len:144 (-) Transcript_9653:370-801(-)
MRRSVREVTEEEKGECNKHERGTRPHAGCPDSGRPQTQVGARSAASVKLFGDPVQGRHPTSAAAPTEMTLGAASASEAAVVESLSSSVVGTKLPDGDAEVNTAGRPSNVFGDRERHKSISESHTRTRRFERLTTDCNSRAAGN